MKTAGQKGHLREGRYCNDSRDGRADPGDWLLYVPVCI